MHTLVVNKSDIESDRLAYHDYDILGYVGGDFTKNIIVKTGLDCKAYREHIKKVYRSVDEQNLRIQNLHKGTLKPEFETTITINEDDIYATSTHICDAIDYAKACNSINNPNNNYNADESLVDLLVKLKTDNLALLINDKLYSHT